LLFKETRKGGAVALKEIVLFFREVDGVHSVLVV
jgi:hypothetical protein